MERIDLTKQELRARAREQLGITGLAADAPPLRDTMSRHRLSWYPILGIGVLAVVDTFHRYAFTVLTPEISRTLGVGRGTMAFAIAVMTLATTLGPVPFAALAAKPRRALLALVAAAVMSLAAIGTGFVTVIWGLLFVLVVDGLTTGGAQALHRPLLMDTYPPEARVRALSFYQQADALGSVVGPLFVALLAGVLLFTWRGVFIVLGVTSLVAVLSAIRLRDPGFGRWDTDQIRATVRAREGEAEESEGDVTLGFFEIMRRLFLIPTIKRMLVSFGVIGIMLVPFQTFLFFFLDERWGLGPGARGLFFAFAAAVGIAALFGFAKRGESAFRQDPARVLSLGAWLLIAAVLLIAAGALSPWFWVMVALVSGGLACIVVLNPAIYSVLLSVTPPRMRPHAGAITGVFLAGVGGFLGVFFLTGIEDRYGIVGAMLSLVVPGVAGALILRSARGLVMADMDRLIDEVIEDEEIRQIRAAGGRLPMLACRGINFSYGELQVLFDVDFTCEEGEMVALLGTNGAGKSTLLKVISGIGLPGGGTVRFEGQDITYLDAERRLGLGITQVPGGRAIFPPLSVVENLRVFGHSLGRSRRRIDDAIARSFDAFPQLAERRNQPAGTLSGGEQQMLALTTALILRPRLLLIDELSLGLAPVIVGQLLEMVRRINADGVSIVLVEQSVNIALTLVEHAYFMEKGEIRFDGRADELLARDDLLRAVFLGGPGGGEGGEAT